MQIRRPFYLLRLVLVDRIEILLQQILPELFLLKGEHVDLALLQAVVVQPIRSREEIGVAIALGVLTGHRLGVAVALVVLGRILADRAQVIGVARPHGGDSPASGGVPVRIHRPTSNERK